MTRIYLAPDQPKRRRNVEQPLKSSPFPLCFKRIHRELDVLDARFAAIGKTLEAKKTQHAVHAREENTRRKVQ